MGRAGPRPPWSSWPKDAMVSGSEGVQGRAVACMQIEDAGVCASYVKRCVHGCVSHRFSCRGAVSSAAGATQGYVPRALATRESCDGIRCACPGLM